MALQLGDRIQQTATANTTVSFSLTGTVLGFQAFSSAITTGNTTYYAATDTSGNWETGIGTLTSTTLLTRTTILSSSNSGSAVTFSGTANVFVTYPSEKSVNQDANNLVAIPYNGASSTIGSLNVGGSTGTADTGYIATFVGNSTTYAYTFTQNTNSGNTAYASHTVGNNAYGSTGAYIDVGVNSTTYSATAAGYPINSLSLPNTTFIESTNGDITIGSWGANAVHFVVNGTTTTQDALTISSAGAVTTPNVLTGAEVVASNGLVVNSNTVSASYSIPSGSSATSAGPMTLASGVAVTVPSGSRWVVL